INVTSTSLGRGPLLAAALCAAAAVQMVAGSAAAQGRPSGDWSLTLGGGALFTPDYEGSDENEVVPVPIVDLSWRDRIRVTTLGGPGIFATPLISEGLRLDLGIRYDFGRDEGDNDALRGLGDLDVGAVAVARLGYELGPVDLGLELARDVTGDREGLAATVEAEYELALLDERARLSVTPHVTWADDEYMGNTFGITAAQAARSARRYTRYDAEAGLKDAGLAVGLGYDLTDSIHVMGRIDYTRLLGDAADSPLVDREGSADQLSALVGLSYRW
uniref:MipA/OmpV family protein n=1 Tax=Arenibaculum pallidiluteum TaxID=2812559 RepID=UPI001A97924E